MNLSLGDSQERLRLKLMQFHLGSLIYEYDESVDDYIYIEINRPRWIPLSVSFPLTATFKLETHHYTLSTISNTIYLIIESE